MVTRCTRPAARRNEDLEAYLEGTALPDVVDHVLTCPVCSREASALKVAHGLLRGALYRDACPETEALFEYQTGDLDPAGMNRISQHLAACTDCRADLAELVQESVELETPAWKQWLKQARQVIQAILAPGPVAPALAVRGAGIAPLLFQAGRYQIVLAAQPELVADRSWRLQGQILQETDLFVPFDDAAIQLIRQDALPLKDSIDEFGYFAFPQIGSGRYSLQIDLSETTIRIEDVNVGSGFDSPRSEHA